MTRHLRGRAKLCYCARGESKEKPPWHEQGGSQGHQTSTVNSWVWFFTRNVRNAVNDARRTAWGSPREDNRHWKRPTVYPDGQIENGERRDTCRTNRRSAYTILVEKPEGDMPLRRPRRRWVIIIKCILNSLEGLGLDWFATEQGHDNKFYKMLGISWLAEEISASQEGLFSMELCRIYLTINLLRLLQRPTC